MKTHDDDLGQERPDASDDRIAALLRATGRRPAAPPAREERVLREAQAAWERVVESRRMRRRSAHTVVALAAAAAVAAAAFLRFQGSGALAPPPPSDPPLLAERIVDDVEVRSPSGGVARLRAGQTVEPGSEIRTGAQGRAALRLGSAVSVRLDRQTTARFLPGRVVSVEDGALYVDASAPGETRIEIRTPLAVVRNLGTRFEIRALHDSVRVRVREGIVSVTAPRGVTQVTAGKEVELRSGGAPEQRDTDPFGPDWDWLTTVTPMMKIEGRSLAEFLDWAARERGLLVRFESDDVARSASTIRLSGSIDGLTLDEALESVLATCSLRHAIRSGLLIVEYDRP